MKRRRILMCCIMAMVMVFALAVPVSVSAAASGTEVTVETVDELKAAISNPDVSEIKLINEIVLIEHITINRELMIDLNGKSLNIGKSRSAMEIAIPSGGNLTITDKSSAEIETQGKLIMYDSIYVSDGGQLNVAGGTISNESSQNAPQKTIHVTGESSKVVVSGGMITNKVETSIYAESGNVEINGGVVEAPKSSKNGRECSGLYIIGNAKGLITGGRISNAGPYSYAVKVSGEAGSKLTVNGGLIENSGIGNTMAIFLGGESSIDFIDGEIINNYASTSSKAVGIFSGQNVFNMQGGTITDKSENAAIYMAGNSEFNLSGGKIISEKLAFSVVNDPIVNITGGVVDAGTYVFYEKNYNPDNPPAAVFKINPESADAVELIGGEGINDPDEPFSPTSEITGGSFSHDVKAYVAGGKNEIKTNETGAPYHVGNDADKAIADAASGDTITVIKADTDLQVPEDVLVDNETGKEITVNNKTVEADAAPQPAGHTLSKVEGTAATCTAEGKKTYYTCATCDKLFTDENGATEINEADLVIPVLPHTFEWIVDKEATEMEKGSKHEECTVCGYKNAPVEIPVITTTDPTDPTKPADPQNPAKPSADSSQSTQAGAQTGDSFDIMMILIIMTIAAAGITGTLCIRRHQ